MNRASAARGAGNAIAAGCRSIGRIVFGDRTGVVVFLACLAVFGLYWRAGQFITDTNTLTHTLAAVADGHLWIDRVGENSFGGPGAVRSGGFVYGRNYGQVFATLPFLVAIRAIDLVADLRVALTALWHLAVLGLFVALGRLLDARTLANVGGSALVLASFVANLALATQFVNQPIHLVALQLVTLLGAALLAVLVYRLVAGFHEGRPATVAGLATGIVLPVGFWAQIPKRHILTALVLVGILLAFARSRSEHHEVRVPGLGPVPAFRAGAYALVGLLAWIHAAEALFVFVALVLVDLPTAPSNDRRTIAVVALAFLLSMVPFFLTNLAIAGNPVRPPRSLSPANKVADGGPGIGTRTGGSGTAEQLPGGFLLDGVVWLSTLITDQVGASLATATEPNSLVQTYIRSGQIQIGGTQGTAEFRAINLSVLESVPLLGALVAVFGTATSAFNSSGRDALSRIQPTDGLAAAIVVSFVLLYTSHLPLHAQITVRYLLPTYPLLLFLAVRQPQVRGLLSYRFRGTMWAYAGGTLVGTQLILTYVVSRELTLAAAAQVHAVLALGAASLLAATLALAAVDDRFESHAAVALGLAAAAGTAFILLSGIAYFSFVGEYVLPVSEAVSDLIGRI